VWRHRGGDKADRVEPAMAQAHLGPNVLPAEDGVEERTVSGDAHLIWRVLKRGWEYRWMLLLALVASAGSGALMAFLLTKLGPFIKYLGGSEAATSTEQLTQATDGLADLGLLLLTLTPAAALASYLAVWAGQWVANRTMEDLRGQVLGHLVRLEISFHQSLTRGELLSRLTNDLTSVLRMQRNLYGKLFQRPLESIGIIGFVMWHDWRLGLGLILILVPLILILAPILRRTRKRSIKARETLVANFGVLEQITAGIKVVKAMGSARREHERYAAHNHKLFDDNMRLARARSVSEAVTSGAVFALSGIGMIGGAWLFANRWLDPGSLFLAIGALARLVTAVRETIRSWGDVQENMPSVGRVYALLDRPSTIADRPEAKPCVPPRQVIRIEQVTFRYQPEAEDVLRGVTLDIPVGKTVALIGRSGAGKSTLLDLLPRFHDVTTGRITFDGTDLRDFQVDTLARHFAIVQQDNFLFNDTIYANIAYGRPDATRAEVENAARRAHVHDDILALEGGLGYETVVGDRGSRLSGGQRQRIAIARALLRDAPILLMDEPTSALDAESERHVQEALTELMKGRTVVVVAHRLATVQHADCIYVLAGAQRRDGTPDPRRGTVVEHGTHQELVTRGGDYAEMVRLQRLGD
jgi:ATP-binding cassette, subfamily B, bacterial MsbA